MKQWIKIGVIFLFGLFLAVPVQAKVEAKNGKFWFNGERQEMVWGRSCFKLANQITYHYTGQGGEHYGLGSARRFVDFHMETLGVPKGFVCRVFLETAAWSPCETGNQVNDGKPDSCMFGSEPRDMGFWNNSSWNAEKGESNRNQLRDGVRQKSLDPVGEKVIEWFYKTSEETGMAFELIINATTKHDRIPAGEIDHIIRQAGVFMGEVMEVKYPDATIIVNYMNEWTAHWPVEGGRAQALKYVNDWAIRTHRDNYFPHSDAAIMVDGGGANAFDYNVGSGDGVYRSGMIHPERGGTEWKTFPSNADMQRLRQDARGQPVGANESMYYISANGRGCNAEGLNCKPNTLNWYRPGGRTANWADYEQFLNWQFDANAVRDGYDYFIIHDDKGAQSIRDWPALLTEVDRWIMNNIGNGGTTPPVDPPPVDPPVDPPEPTQTYYDNIIQHGYDTILGRPSGEEGLAVYNDWLRKCYLDESRQCFTFFVDVLARSQEYMEKNTR